MPGYSPKLPLAIDSLDGIVSLTKNFAEVAKQNFKMLVLTNPGERIMDADFGVGITGFLFEPDAYGIREAIEERIISQTEKYLPYIIIDDIDINNDDEFFNKLDVRISYRVSDINISDVLQITS